jgi:hypothetical protein
MDLRKTGMEFGHWIRMAQDMNGKRVLVKTVIKLRVP